MAIFQVTKGVINNLDKFWDEIQSWFDYNWRCSETNTLPELEWVKHLVSQKDTRVAVSYTDNKAIGFVIYRVSDAKILWLTAIPTNFAGVAEELCVHVYNDTGLIPWGVVGRETPLNAFLNGGFAEITYNHPQYPEGHVIRLSGVEG